jgi:hypothetical protein
MHESPRFFNRSRGCNQSLAGYLSTEDSLPILVRRETAKQVDFDGFEVEKRNEIVECFLHISILPSHSLLPCN